MKNMISKSGLFLKVLLPFFVLFLGLSPVGAQTQPAYRSQVDQELQIDRVLVLPLTDNLSGIYANPLTEKLNTRLALDPRWTLVSANNPPGRMDESPSFVQSQMKEYQVNAVLQGRILKGPAGITLKLVLFVGPQGRPLLVEEVTEPTEFSTEHIANLMNEALGRLRDRLPAHGVVASRRGQQVTINLGRNSGLRTGDIVDIIQILKVNRHPKHQFMISTEKEILGKAEITKADEELSFATLTFEKEAGVVTPGQKVLAPRPIIYPGALGSPLAQEVAFGEKPFEWLPTPTPQYGRLQVLAGIGQNSHSITLQNAGNLSGDNSFSPALGLMAEGWLNREWWIGFSLRQSNYSINNKLNGSSPSKINLSQSKYDVSAGYNFLLSDDFFGPKLQISLGMAKFTSRADDSQPPSYASTEYGGTVLGFSFETNLGPEIPWELGARMKYYLSPEANLSGGAGSASSVSANDFGFLIAKRVRQNFRYIGEINFEYYSADLKNSSRNDPVTATSHRSTTVYVGLEYAF